MSLISVDVKVMGITEDYILMRFAYLKLEFITRQNNNRKLEKCLLMVIAYFNQADIKTIKDKYSVECTKQVSGRNYIPV